MFASLMNQDIIVKTKGTINDNNEATYVSSTIKGRFEYNKQMFRTKAGQDIVAFAVLYTTSDVDIDDIIYHDGYSWPVTITKKIVDITGTFSHNEVLLGVGSNVQY